jgi:hypothetical protein
MYSGLILTTTMHYSMQLLSQKRNTIQDIKMYGGVGGSIVIHPSSENKKDGYHLSYRITHLQV